LARTIGDGTPSTRIFQLGSNGSVGTSRQVDAQRASTAPLRRVARDGRGFVGARREGLEGRQLRLYDGRRRRVEPTGGCATAGSPRNAAGVHAIVERWAVLKTAVSIRGELAKAIPASDAAAEPRPSRRAKRNAKKPA
jgi:hypothetical protein